MKSEKTPLSLEPTEPGVEAPLLGLISSKLVLRPHGFGEIVGERGWGDDGKVGETGPAAHDDEELAEVRELGAYEDTSAVQTYPTISKI